MCSKLTKCTQTPSSQNRNKSLTIFSPSLKDTVLKIKQKDSDQKDELEAPTIVASPKLVRPKEPKINGFTTAKVGNLSKDGFSPRLIVGNS